MLNKNFFLKKEIAQIMGISLSTLDRWLKPINNKIGKKTGKFYSKRQLKIIFEHLDFEFKEDF
ncbi:MAG: helix-turn-helix domain-containing protein [Bacteroidetes bacterium]|nr:helix-turn-helix domain-containing protein [Bacteroidota bacterium]